MYIGYYKSTDSKNEFYSEKRNSLDFPTQISLRGKRYSLVSTHIVSSPGKETNLISRAKELGIETGVKID